MKYEVYKILQKLTFLKLVKLLELWQRLKEMNFEGIRSEEIKAFAAVIIAEEFRMGLSSGMIPADSDETEVNLLYEFTVDLLYELVSSDPELKMILIESQRQNVKLSLADLFNTCAV